MLARDDATRQLSEDGLKLLLRSKTSLKAR